VRPVGHVSYALYLLPWPLLVITRFVDVHPGLTAARIAVLVLTLLAVSDGGARRVRAQVPAAGPAPAAAKVEENGPCRHFRREAGVGVCDFGVAPEQATRDVALVGDSHASHWRAALDVVAGERGWRGLSVTHTSCPFSKATKLLPGPTRSGCVRWVKALPGYVRSHPEIDTLFVVGITGGKVHVPPGRTMFEAKVDGYRGAWSELPDTVKHIVVIRDTPKMFRSTVACVDRALAEHKLAHTACAVPRRTALAPDPQVVAAHEERTRHVQVVDLTRRLCSSRQCFPVIGGVQVYKDVHHFTLVFSKTLGPPLARAVDRAMSTW
jgi:SGNH domain-containing protein